MITMYFDNLLATTGYCSPPPQPAARSTTKRFFLVSVFVVVVLYRAVVAGGWSLVSLCMRTSCIFWLLVCS